MADPIYLIEAAAFRRAMEYCEQNDVTPISLRELFLRHRGVKQVSKNACVLLMRICSEYDFCTVYSILAKNNANVVLTIETTLTVGQCEKLLALPHITVVPAYTYENTNDTVVFCEKVSADAVQHMRKNGVRMVLTTDKPSYCQLPNGMVVLYASPLPACMDINGSRLEKETNRLLLDTEPMFSDWRLAIPLSIIGTERELLARTLASHTWKTTYVPSQDCYTVDLNAFALHSIPFVVQGDINAALQTYLSDGCYIWLQLQAHVHTLDGAESLLLYGYEDTSSVFVAYTSLQKGIYSCIDLLPQTVIELCKMHGTKAYRCTLDRTASTCDTDAFVESLRETPVSDGKIYYGREAAVRYANRFYKRFADGTEKLSASSLRTFLEERKRYGFALWYHAIQNDYYLPPFENHLRTLAEQVGKALQDLQGKDVLVPEIPLFLTSELMRNLLNAEESLISAFLDEYERAQHRQYYLENTRTKNVRL